MAYFQYLIKRIFKNKFTLIIMPIMLALSLGYMFLLYQNESDESTALGNLQRNLVMQKNSLSSAENKLEKVKNQPDSKEYKELSDEIATWKKLVKEGEPSIAEANKGNYRALYDYAINLQKMVDQQNKDLKNNDPSAKRASSRYLTEYQYLKNKNIPEEYKRTMGTSFILELENYIFPVLLSLIAVFILSIIFSERFKGSIDTENIFPQSVIKTEGNRIAAGTISTLILFLIMISILFIVTSILSGIGSFDYPVMIEKITGFEVMTTRSMFMQILILRTLSLIFIATMVNLISLLIRNKILVILISSILTVGLALLPMMILPLNKIAHLLPNTYFFSEISINGVLAFGEMNNHQINFQNGLISLILSIIAFFMISLIIQNFRVKGRYFLKIS